MSNFPEEIDVFVDKTGFDDIASSDPNVAYDGLEATQGLIGALGKPQSWSNTLISLLKNYRRNLLINVDSGTITVSAGQAVLKDTNSSKIVFRENIENVAITAANLDVGSLVATYYFIYGKAGSAATTVPLIFSTDSITPSAIGTIPFIKLGWFKNEGVGALAVTFAGNIKDGASDVPNQAFAFGVSDAVISSTTFEDVPELLINMVTNGRPVFVNVNIPTYWSAAALCVVEANINIDGSQKMLNFKRYNTASAEWDAIQVFWQGILEAGKHTIKAQWRLRAGGAGVVANTTSDGARFINAIEL